jgi:hypothetical protein
MSLFTTIGIKYSPRTFRLNLETYYPSNTKLKKEVKLFITLDFLFDKFYHEELLKLYTYAEKLGIYLTPFVLKVNIKLIYYDYGKDCNIQTKLFSSYLDNKPTLLLLYRKCHYDLAYSHEFVNKYANLMNIFMEYRGLKVTDWKLIQIYQEKANNVDVMQSKIYNSKDKEEKVNKSKPTTKDQIEKEIEELRLKLSTLESKAKCKMCTKGIIAIYLDIKEGFYCNNCIILKYVDFMKFNKEGQKKGQICDSKYIISTLVLGFFKIEGDMNILKFYDQLKIVKDKICLNGCIIKTQGSAIKLPCECLLCDISCIYKFETLMGTFSTSFKCLCSYKYNLHELIALVDLFDTYDLKSPKIKLTIELNNIFFSTCMYCKANCEQGSSAINLADKVIAKFLNIQSIPHMICSTCKYDANNLCSICLVKH